MVVIISFSLTSIFNRETIYMSYVYLINVLKVFRTNKSFYYRPFSQSTLLEEIEILTNSKRVSVTSHSPQQIMALYPTDMMTRWWGWWHCLLWCCMQERRSACSDHRWPPAAGCSDAAAGTCAVWPSLAQQEAEPWPVTVSRWLLSAASRLNHTTGAALPSFHTPTIHNGGHTSHT